MGETFASRNYFQHAAVRAKTLEPGDVLVGTDLVILNVYSDKTTNVTEVMRGSVMAVRTLGAGGVLGSEGLTDPAVISMKLASGYILVKASATGKDDLEENVFFLVPAVRILEIPDVQKQRPIP